MRGPQRAVLLLLSSAAFVIVAAAPALAHGSGGSDAGNFRSTVTGVAPATDVPGNIRPPKELAWRVLANDAVLQVDNSSRAEITIAGYEGEPYLRIGPDGVFVNRNSPARYLNEDRYAQTPVPDHADPEVTPAWEKVSDASRYGWHDHRIHWMSPAVPPQVRADPNQPQLITAWQVPFTWQGRELAVEGTLRWVPPPSWWPWVLGAAAVVTAPVALAVALARGSRRRDAALRTAAVTLLAVAVVDAVHAAGDLMAVPATFSENLYAGLQSAAFIAIGVFGARSAWRGRAGAATAVVVAGFALALGIGLTHFTVLTSSQVASAGPDWFARAVTAANLTLVLPMALAALASGDFWTAAVSPEVTEHETVGQP